MQASKFNVAQIKGIVSLSVLGYNCPLLLENSRNVWNSKWQTQKILEPI